MDKLKMALVAGTLVAIAVISFAGLAFSDDTQTAPSSDGTVMTNTSTAAPAPAAE